jgi:hypothetical protein
VEVKSVAGLDKTSGSQKCSRSKHPASHQQKKDENEKEIEQQTSASHTPAFHRRPTSRRSSLGGKERKWRSRGFEGLNEPACRIATRDLHHPSLISICRFESLQISPLTHRFFPPKKGRLLASTRPASRPETTRPDNRPWTDSLVHHTPQNSRSWPQNGAHW